MSSLFKSRLVAKELPFSTYLANQGWKVADIPLHPDITSPEELLKLPAASCRECSAFRQCFAPTVRNFTIFRFAR
ncbi:MAG: kinase/pyrophosphorylase [Deltaproteobacteria bacterium]|nr:kinase/pyrophosphorylase [Deltaproteobacteria bacterium]MBW2173106.1 kinase/pyrophosphorylase [Deltaproteobacteria bacterium]